MVYLSEKEDGGTGEDRFLPKIKNRRRYEMAILVTGGAGFIGSHTCVELLDAGYEVVVVDNLYNSSKKALERVEKITGKHVTF